MARVTVEDCLENVSNRFELVMIASKRARQIATGGKEPLVKEDGDKPTVLALREIEENLINAEILLEAEQAEQALREELQSDAAMGLDFVGETAERQDEGESEAAANPAQAADDTAAEATDAPAATATPETPQAPPPSPTEDI